LKKFAFVDITISISSFDKRTCDETENPNHIHHREPASGSLGLALRPFLLVECRVRHGKASSVNESDLPSMPEILRWNLLLHLINEVCVDLIQHVEGEFVTGLAIGTRGLADRRGGFSAYHYASEEGRDSANRLATGAIGRLNLMKKTPENNIQGKNATAGLASKCVLRKQLIWNVRVKSFAEMGKGTRLRKLGKSLCGSRNRCSTKEKRAETFKERCCMIHGIYRITTVTQSQHKKFYESTISTNKRWPKAASPFP
jgi:hypothetical protein